MGPRVLYPLHLWPIVKNLSMQHISGYNLIQGALGCSVASPLGVAMIISLFPFLQMGPKDRNCGLFEQRGRKNDGSLTQNCGSIVTMYGRKFDEPDA